MSGLVALFLALAAANVAPAQVKLIAQTYNSGFPEGHDTYNGMGTGSDGKIYYVLSSPLYNIGAKMFCYDPAKDRI